MGKTYAGENNEIIRGSIWPPGENDLTITVTDSSGWPAGADGWTWTLELSEQLTSDTVTLSLTADTVTLSGNDIILTFSLTETETGNLEPGTMYVELKSDNAGTISYYDSMQGKVKVRDPIGG